MEGGREGEGAGGGRPTALVELGSDGCTPIDGGLCSMRYRVPPCTGVCSA